MTQIVAMQIFEAKNYIKSFELIIVFLLAYNYYYAITCP